jgi:hypothetical protein
VLSQRSPQSHETTLRSGGAWLVLPLVAIFRDGLPRPA